ncbi:MAG TPA: peptidase MA family metallohydrolase [Candidatus Angelobacter sp.]|nr:peptidase MA family metallohydrolase [Candidatus Angelobacter sp.]
MLQFFRLRLIITFCCLAIGAAQADTIYLKNGSRIVVDSVQETNGHVEYTIGDGTYAIPASLVVRIESGPGATPASPAASEAPPPREQMQTGTDLISRVIHDGRIDASALHEIELENVPERSATAYFLAGQFEEKRHDLQAAAHYLQTALGFMPANGVLLENYGAVLIKLGRIAEGLSYTQQAVRASPQSAEAFAQLGYAWYKSNRNRDAIAAWKKSLQLRPSDVVQSWLARAERETKTEAEFRQQESNHFVLSYEGSQAPESLRNQLLGILEAQYKVLTTDLGVSPRSIYVSLYSDQAFFDVTQAPAWSAALNDGKIRIPFSGMSEVTPELARVLRHELTHSFVRQIVHGHAPQWLNEGLAQIEEGKTTSPVGVRLAALYTSGNQIPLNRLEGPFESFSAPEAFVAYAESLAAAEYMRNQYGMAELAELLRRLGQGESVESALRATIHTGYSGLEAEIAGYLKKSYAQ